MVIPSARNICCVFLILICSAIEVRTSDAVLYCLTVCGAVWRALSFKPLLDTVLSLDVQLPLHVTADEALYC